MKYCKVLFKVLLALFLFSVCCSYLLWREGVHYYIPKKRVSLIHQSEEILGSHKLPLSNGTSLKKDAFSSTFISTNSTVLYDSNAPFRSLPPTKKTMLMESLRSYKDIVTHYGNSPQGSKVKCNTCALVGSSGMLRNSTAGNEIDSNDCVIRMNDAPTSGYEKDVGNKTTFRMFGRHALDGVIKLLRDPKSEQTSSILIVYETIKNGEEYLKNLFVAHPNSSIYHIDDVRVKYVLAKFAKETGNSIKGSWLSCGWKTMLFAKDICGIINVYGMVDENYCEQVFAKKLPDTPYHYYNWRSVLQCAVYKRHENATAGHRYITEKRIFKKWAKESGKIAFFHPRWQIT